MNVPEDLKYTKDHEWVTTEGDIATIGITNHAQEQLGDVVFVELPEVGKSVQQDDTIGAVESVKAASDFIPEQVDQVRALGLHQELDSLP